jgi:hypothetical protein
MPKARRRCSNKRRSKMHNRTKRGGDGTPTEEATPKTYRTTPFYRVDETGKPRTVGTATFYNVSEGEMPPTSKPNTFRYLPTPTTQEEVDTFFAKGNPEDQRQAAQREFDDLMNKHTALNTQHTEAQHTEAQHTEDDCPDGVCTIMGGRKSRRNRRKGRKTRKHYRTHHRKHH